MTITKGILKEKLHRKDIYIVSAIGILILLAVGSGSMEITLAGERLTDYAIYAPIILTILWVLAGSFCIGISLNTIPNEYKRGTSHLVWIRNISQGRYHMELAMGNVLSALAMLALIYLGFAGFVLSKGTAADLLRVPPAFIISCLPVAALCLFTCVTSVILPGMVSGMVSMAVLIIGTAHPLLVTASNALTGFAGKAVRAFIAIMPDFYTMHSQAGNILLGKPLDAHSLICCGLIIYVAANLLLILKRKAA